MSKDQNPKKVTTGQFLASSTSPYPDTPYFGHIIQKSSFFYTNLENFFLGDEKMAEFLNIKCFMLDFRVHAMQNRPNIIIFSYSCSAPSKT